MVFRDNGLDMIGRVGEAGSRVGAYHRGQNN
jgi:hypothetical protein